MAILIASQPDAIGVVHRLEHVVDESIELIVHVLDLSGLLLQDRVVVCVDREDHC